MATAAPGAEPLRMGRGLRCAMVWPPLLSWSDVQDFVSGGSLKER